MNDEPRPNPEALARALAEPFDPEEVKWKPQAVSGQRALAIAYVDARVIMDRLDDAAGADGWKDDYEVLPEGQVVCRLEIRFGDEWVRKVDVGGQSEQPDDGDKVKAAFSDALKRAAVKFGLGRYLYRLPHQWVDYDPQKRQFKGTPKLPAFALPKAKRAERKTEGKAPVAPGQPAQPLPDKTALPKKAPKSPAAKLRDDVNKRDVQLAQAGVIAAGELANELLEYGKEEGFHVDLLQWSEEDVSRARKHLATWVGQKEAEKRARELAQVKGG